MDRSTGVLSLFLLLLYCGDFLKLFFSLQIHICKVNVKATSKNKERLNLSLFIKEFLKSVSLKAISKCQQFHVD